MVSKQESNFSASYNQVGSLKPTVPPNVKARHSKEIRKGQEKNESEEKEGGRKGGGEKKKGKKGSYRKGILLESGKFPSQMI